MITHDYSLTSMNHISQVLKDQIQVHLPVLYNHIIHNPLSSMFQQLTVTPTTRAFWFSSNLKEPMHYMLKFISVWNEFQHALHAEIHSTVK